MRTNTPVRRLAIVSLPFLATSGARGFSTRLHWSGVSRASEPWTACPLHSRRSAKERRHACRHRLPLQGQDRWPGCRHLQHRVVRGERWARSLRHHRPLQLLDRKPIAEDSEVAVGPLVVNIPERTDPSCPTASPRLRRVVGGVAMGDDPAGARNHGTPATPGATGTAASAQAMSPPRLLDRVRQAIRARHYSPRTEKAYVGWIRRYIFFHGKRHPDQMGAPEVTRFLSALATRSKVSASTQNQAFSALLFLYRDVLGRQLTGLKETVRAKPSVRVPLVLARDEVSAILRHLHGVEWLMASVMYGAGLRLLECCHLRVKDLDFTKREITVRDGHTALPRPCHRPLAAAPPSRNRPSAGIRGCRARRAGGQARNLPHATSQLRHRPPGAGLRHPHHPGAPGSQRRQHDDDLHPRPQPRRPGVTSPLDTGQ